jgi:hypothetical protein
VTKVIQDQRGEVDCQDWMDKKESRVAHVPPVCRVLKVRRDPQALMAYLVFRVIVAPQAMLALRAQLVTMDGLDCQDFQEPRASQDYQVCLERRARRERRLLQIRCRDFLGQRVTWDCLGWKA